MTACHVPKPDTSELLVRDSLKQHTITNALRCDYDEALTVYD